MAELMFFAIAACVAVFSVLVVMSRDIFHSSVWLAMTLLSVAGLYFYLEAPFLGVIQILVYVGGIITLFVFAIKLTARIGDKTIQQANQQVAASAISALILFVILLKVIGKQPWGSELASAQTISLKQLGESLVTTYMFPFEFISVILLAAMVGAIVIGKEKK